jgi:hypothetical protein
MMPGELTTSDVDWTQLQDTVLEGGYQLEAILAADEREATFKTRVLGDPAANAFAKLFVAGESEAEQQAADWLRARQLAGRYLALPLGAGHTHKDGATLAYVVARRADETLNDALAERGLSKEEASEVLLALARGLEQLHSHGLVHGCVSPEQIVAVGDSIQLSTESVRNVDRDPLAYSPRPRYRAPESGHFNSTPEADIWCVGATLIEILTQQRCGEECAEQAAKLPPPFDRLALKCLETDPAARPKPHELEALLLDRPRAESKKAPLAPRAPRPVTVPAAANGSVAAPPVIPMRPRPTGSRPMGSRQDPKLRAWWIYAAAGIVVVLALIWLLRPRQQAITNTKPAATASAPTPRGTAWESKTITPDDGRPPARPAPSSTSAGPTASAPIASAARPGTSIAPAPSAPPPAASTANSSEFVKGPVWRVVLYTYATQADADNKAQSVNAKYPSLGAETFSPGGGSPFLVVAGGRMNRDEAARLRQKVRGMGLPRDSYIQNYQR